MTFPAEKLQSDVQTAVEALSKSLRKRAMHELQELGEALIKLDAARLAALPLPERLADAIAQARVITQHEGRRRQLQYIGKLMRGVDPAPIKSVLARWARGPNAARARFAQTEQWRDRILADAAGLEAFLAAYPGADRTALAALVNSARAERSSGSPPHKSRALFRALARIIGESSEGERNG